MRYRSKAFVTAAALTAALGTAAVAQSQPTQVLEDTAIDATLSIGSGEEVVVRGTVTVNGPPASGEFDPAVSIGGDGTLTLEGLLDADGLSQFGQELIQITDAGRLDVPNGLSASLTNLNDRGAVRASGQSEVRFGEDAASAFSFNPLVVLSDSAVLVADGSRLITNGDHAIEASGSSRIVFDGGAVDGINDTAILFNDAATGTFQDTELGSVTLNGTSAADFFDTVGADRRRCRHLLGVG